MPTETSRGFVFMPEPPGGPTGVEPAAPVEMVCGQFVGGLG